MSVQRLDLGLTSSSAACCGGDGYSCDLPAYIDDTVLTELSVEGMTCEHCVRAVTDELSRVDGVDEVSVALAPEGLSRVIVRGSAALDRDAARAAVAEAGYTLVD
jgi:copper chaperone